MNSTANILQTELDALLAKYDEKELLIYKALVDTELSYTANSTSYDIITKENDTNG